MATVKARDIDEYISRYSQDTQKRLAQIRATIKKAVPDAEETISYGIPTFNLNGTYLIYFAAYDKHISVYPVPGTLELDKEFESYKTSGKGTMQFPLNEPMPLNLIAKLANLQLEENIKRTANKKHKRK